MGTPVLYHNANYTVILVDIPASIEHAQQSLDILTSCPVLEAPYPSTEPKGLKRENALSQIPSRDRRYHSSVQASIRQALTEIQVIHIEGQYGAWYRPSQRISSSKVETDPRFNVARSSLGSSRDSASDGSSLMHAVRVPAVLSSTELRNDFPALAAVRQVVIHNPRSVMSFLYVAHDSNFVIPAHATFIQATLEAGWESFVIGSQTLLASNRCWFDLILMDPPWANRSARRSSSYHTAESQLTDPFDHAVQIVEKVLAPHGLVAVWITNKASIRNTVLDVFRALNLVLHEEWVWIKITAKGQPVTPLDGIWRRPYEVCLLFRTSPRPDSTPRRRVIAAAPDLHSRKPSLKTLLELHLPAQYQALELFARSLTAGWWSWGDEVLKFQHESHWIPAHSAEAS